MMQDVAEAAKLEGWAIVATANAGYCDVRQIDTAGQDVAEPLHLSPVSVGCVTWLDGFFPEDRWVDCEVSLFLEEVSRLGLRCYLPQIAGRIAKRLTAYFDGVLLQEFDIPRGQSSELWITLALPGTGTLSLRSSSPKSSVGDDVRDLGFMVSHVNVNDADWISPNSLL
ncbi:hypothetical protein [Jiella sonneratiae]|uniref:Uncharacterized protein n=1 Tax=Jiella sonneratiae TaxID=2816856 RepID=A0ABS3J140_9HYPH|nr:hypothetical protein [Jiella sonneratiae]MBO0903404.1 hypothetical protein [Jiella sonneratiae]